VSQSEEESEGSLVARHLDSELFNTQSRNLDENSTLSVPKYGASPIIR